MNVRTVELDLRIDRIQTLVARLLRYRHDPVEMQDLESMIQRELRSVKESLQPLRVASDGALGSQPRTRMN